jgi:hypothetical protein
VTIKQAIERLKALEAKHGSEIEVFYDCAHCGKSTKPDVIVAAVSLNKKA